MLSLCPREKRPATLSLSILLLLGACATVPVPAEVHTQWLTGHWQGHDAAGWVYFLDVDDTGAFQQRISAPDSPACAQHGRMVPQSGRLHWDYTLNTCNEVYQGIRESFPVRVVDGRTFQQERPSYVVTYVRRR